MDSIYSYNLYTESWIEISSQPSSSSLSSIDTDPNSLRVHYDQFGRRRRRLNRNEPLPPGVPVRRSSAAESSQEEYEESESESDRIMTSSNEALEHNAPEDVSPPALASSVSEETSSNNAEDDYDEKATAIGTLTNEPVFTPQPNAFSHPPQSFTTRHPRSVETRTSYFPAQRGSPQRRPAAHSYPSRSRTSHTPYNMIAPSHTADHDAALRASLSTLLSCAAAARGLSKRESPSMSQHPNKQSNRVGPSTLRLVPESALTGEELPPALPARPSVRHRGSVTSLSSNDKGKRKASSSKERQKESCSKKRRANSPGRDRSPHVTPTLMTWVISAGVVVLFSAISFSAGYAVGKEVGRVETGTMNGKDGIVCGKEVSKGLRRLRWGASSVSVIRV